ncbi:SRPBCC family protein [Aquipuribacter sp. MA13-6]|uniref:SRPBCC family protein n=1 Tax=unclassified Aquipuribacter TaxID=2635084 RepID=UPI003EEB9F33
MRPAVARASGPVHPDEAWDRYARPERWSQWSPQVRGVEMDADVIVAGSAGTVRTLGGAQVQFVVLDVDPRARSWSWRVRVGPVGMVLEHHLQARPEGGTRAEVVIHAAWPVARLYRLPATVALHRLVH